MSKPQINRDQYLGNRFVDSELVIGLVGAVGTELKLVTDILEERLKAYRYTPNVIQVSRRIIPLLEETNSAGRNEFERISKHMDAGNAARAKAGDNSILALGVAAEIAAQRTSALLPQPRNATIFHSLKHPEEIIRLRQIYPQAFFLIGVYAEEKRRRECLISQRRLSEAQALQLMERDADERLSHGQKVSEAFHLSDAFVHLDENRDRLRNSIWRTLEIIFGHPHTTPTFDEYAMFLAFSAALRSADLSRQVGAVITQEDEIIATGANDCPKSNGGLYWPECDQSTGDIRDVAGGRDHVRGFDANKREQQKIVEDIVERLGHTVDAESVRMALKASPIGDITEYGRIVHAEMEALMSCARSTRSARGGTLYCTTFPCHNCAKHIVAAGIKRVVYVEPYPKSKAAELHDDSISLGFPADKNKVSFQPFVGFGPRRFFDVFSMGLGSGVPIKRKDKSGTAVAREIVEASLRIQMLPCSYLDLEQIASTMFDKVRENNYGSTTIE